MPVNESGPKGTTSDLYTKNDISLDIYHKE